MIAPHGDADRQLLESLDRDVHQSVRRDAEFERVVQRLQLAQLQAGLATDDRHEVRAARPFALDEARVALGAVAATVLLPQAAADALVGSTLDDNALDALAAACSEASSPIDDKRGTVAFRKQVAGVLARRAAQTAYTRAGGK